MTNDDGTPTPHLLESFRVRPKETQQISADARHIVKHLWLLLFWSPLVLGLLFGVIRANW